MEQLHGVGRHQLGGEAGNIGLAGEAFELGDALPIDIVVPETARRSGGHVLGEVLPGSASFFATPAARVSIQSENTPRSTTAPSRPNDSTRSGDKSGSIGLTVPICRRSAPICPRSDAGQVPHCSA